METRKEKAIHLFKEGYNCSQSVFAAYSDLYGIDLKTALKLSSSFGGGMGRMREVCGAVSGMFLIAGLETGTTEGSDVEGKKYNYDIVQQMAKDFKEKNGSIICKELLGLKKSNIEFNETTPENRTQTYYQKRPCIRLVEDAADIIEKRLLNKQTKRIFLIPVTDKEQIIQLARLADIVWHEYFVSILSKTQIDYMVEKFQSVSAMTNQIENQNYHYFFLNLDGVNIGYTGVQPDKDNKLFLSKLYIQKEYRGKGYAREAFDFLEGMCKGMGLQSIWLTVNRFNENSIKVYEKRGFQTVRTQVTDIGNNYVMDDYVMEKTLS